ncbi:MAG: cysteine desulfurase [Lachnospiraceae bacterium]|nr:cysteine desulfurase [Lachnospiraceae bacterium]
MIYLDNSATTRTYDEVTEYMSEVTRECFGNPSSMHMAGVEAEKVVRTAAERIAGILKCDTKEIVFTSGGTESDNLAIIGSALANRRKGMHIITPKTEHPAVKESVKHLEGEGFKVTYLDVTSDGRVDADSLRGALSDETILVSIMHVNNEIGSLNDIAKLSGIVKEFDPSIIFHTDAVQSFGKTELVPKKMKIDLVSVSAHKIHGPKGVGFLYVAGGTKINPVIFGGGQQKGLRSGTENVPGIAGVGLASKLAYDNFDENINRLYDLKSYFIRQLQGLPDVTVNGLFEGKNTDEAIRQTAPHIISASFEDVRAEVLLHALESKGIYVSSGSACSSNRPAKSATLTAIGLDQKLLDSTIRFSMSPETTKEELDETLAALTDELPKLRRYTRR